MSEDNGYKEAILNGAKAAREIGKSRERTFAIGEGLVAMRCQCLIAMGKDPRINDRTILKSGKYRELMGKALKTYPAYTLATVFRNDSTRLAYMYCAEYRTQIETAFAAEEVKNPNTTLRIVNPERIKSKFKALTDPPKKKAATKAAAKEAAEQDRDAELIEARKQRDEVQRDYNQLFERVIDFDQTPAEQLVDILLDTKAANRKNRLRFIDLVVEYATGERATKKVRTRKEKAPPSDEGGFSPEALEALAAERPKRKRKGKTTPSEGYNIDGELVPNLKDEGSPEHFDRYIAGDR